MTIREQLEQREREILAPQAATSGASRGRLRPEAEDPIRPAFQRDRDRIIHTKAFRRLKHKTQVFFSPRGDHYRTRLTHTLEVSQIARTIAKVLHLHEELTEAIALGHDLGHTPFGHAGERVLSALVPGGFNHYEQSLRIVDVLERDGSGLNLTWEVRDGIARHSKGKHGMPVGAPPEHRASTIEGQIARVADIMAYVNHDIDDADQSGHHQRGSCRRTRWLCWAAVPSARIGRLVINVVEQTLAGGLTEIRMSDEVLDAMLALRVVHVRGGLRESGGNGRVRQGPWHPERTLGEGAGAAGAVPGPPHGRAGGAGRAAQDFVAGMTDRYAVNLFEQLFIPKPWVTVTDGPRML